jgi:hypothetical protein
MIDTLYQQAEPWKCSYQANESVNREIAVLEKMQQLLDSSAFGLEVESMLFPHDESNDSNDTYRK